MNYENGKMYELEIVSKMIPEMPIITEKAIYVKEENAFLTEKGYLYPANGEALPNKTPDTFHVSVKAIIPDYPEAARKLMESMMNAHLMKEKDFYSKYHGSEFQMDLSRAKAEMNAREFEEKLYQDLSISVQYCKVVPFIKMLNFLTSDDILDLPSREAEEPLEGFIYSIPLTKPLTEDYAAELSEYVNSHIKDCVQERED